MPSTLGLGVMEVGVVIRLSGTEGFAWLEHALAVLNIATALSAGVAAAEAAGAGGWAVGLKLGLAILAGGCLWSDGLLRRVRGRLLLASLHQPRAVGAAGSAVTVERAARDAGATLAEVKMYQSATLDLSASVSRVVARLSEARSRVDRSARAADQVVVRLFDAVAEGSSGRTAGGHRFCRTQGVTPLSGQALAAE